MRYARIFQTFDEQFVAVDDVRPTVSDGLYSNCTPPPTPSPPSVFYTTPPPPPQKKKDPKCTASNLSSNVSTVWPNEEAHGD